MSTGPIEDGLRVLLIGSGGREHAIAEGLARSPHLTDMYIAPGNAGTVDNNVELDIGSNLAIVDFCVRNGVDLVVVGPEAPLVAGIADDLHLAGVACFGPSSEASQLEGSKSFARAFAARHGIPGPMSESFTEVDSAIAWLDAFDGKVVVKADGLASGKGVIVAETRVETERAIFDLLAERTMGDAGETVVLEERLYGEEISLFGIADGATVVPLVTAQDHKRVGEGNTGLNTGGMGAFAPVPGVTAELEAELTKQFLVTAVEGMAAEGMPYVGVLYAGIMLTDAGPRLIEYNCRFGDPEAQAIVPLIETDLLAILFSAATGELAATPIEVKPDTSVAIVVAAEGYPTDPIDAVPVPDVELPDGAQLIHAGTRFDGESIVSDGGRILNVVGLGDDLAAALAVAYPVVDELTGNGLFARSDIGWRHAPRGGATGRRGAAATAYESAGVSLTAAAATTARISAAVASTHDDRVVAGLGSFGGVFDVSALSSFDEPLLVASTDGVGTKTLIAGELDRWEGCGADIVNHGVNDVLVQGARPLFFLDTVAAAVLDPEVVGRIVDGMAAACREAGCVLLGGETAEMPDVLAPASVDVSGTVIGAVDRADLLPNGAIAPGHQLVGLASSGLHTNGYSLARKVFAGMDLQDQLPGGAGESIGDALLAVHRSYLRPLSLAIDAGLVDGLAHITGGGFVDNIPRILPAGCGATIDTSSWTRPVLFNYLLARASLAQADAYQIFNCGIGMVAVIAPETVDEFRAAVPEETWIIGEVTIGRGVDIR
jgi:phosphoribosylamine--glycine ligase/phosphoribosylformylglycinamidine cyclo-ligase